MRDGPKTGPSEPGRFLPTNIKPIHYAISIAPDLNTRVYKGNIAIDLEVLEPSTSVTINVHKDIHFLKTDVIYESKELNGIRLSRDEKHERYTVDFGGISFKRSEKLQLRHSFEGWLNDEMNGFYRTTYRDDDGNDRYIANTQGQPSSARRSFPCFDEPGIKATFSVTLVIDKHQTCLMNMPVDVEKEIDGKVHISFQKTPPMSAYLICLIVGEGFHSVRTDEFRVPITIYTASQSAAKRAKFSLDLAVKIMRFFEEKFQAEYPLPKLDMAAFPNFFPGAMENWGLIVFNPDLLLYDEETQGQASKQHIVEVAVHEMSHQWFGDLVTTKTWDSTWLNEGFADWATLYAINTLYPSWLVWDAYIASGFPKALALDSLRHSHPIEQEAQPGREGEVLDAISYEKGSAVLRMISNMLGEEEFVNGVAYYINKFKYSATFTTDLWECLAHVSGVDVSSVMNDWVLTTGYPVLSTRNDFEAGTLTVTQHRFLNTGDASDEEDKIWPIDLRCSLLNDNVVIPTPMLNKRTLTLAIPKDAYKLNAKHTGFYRTNYEPSSFNDLVGYCVMGKLTIQDRAGLVGDAAALAAAGYGVDNGMGVGTKTLHVLEAIERIARAEDSSVVWATMLDALGNVGRAWTFEGDDMNQGLAAFVRKVVGVKLRSIGWSFSPRDDEEAVEKVKLKVSLFNAACKSGDEEIIHAACEMFEKYRNGEEEALHPNIRSAVFGASVAAGIDDAFDFLLNLYVSQRTTGNAAVASDVRSALGRSPHNHLRKKLMDMWLDRDKIASIDITYFADGFGHRPDSITQLWQWAKENWDKVIARMTVGIPMAAGLVKACTQRLATSDSAYEDVETFFKEKNRDGILDLAVGQSLDVILGDVKWVEGHGEELRDWLRQQ